MIRVEANTLEEAYSKAARELSCSVTELDLVVVQYPKSGFLGLGKKIAIVEAKKIGELNFNQRNDGNFHNKNKSFHQKKHAEKSEKHDRREHHKNNSKEFKKPAPIPQQTVVETPKVQEKEQKTEVKRKEPLNTSTMFDERFHREKTDPAAVAGEIQEKIKSLFDNLCFEITSIDVLVYDEETLLIEIDGPDAALLIGKEGCRYKAISYMFYSWINLKYRLGIRLEIAEFLKSQEEMMGRYLTPIIERIYTHGKAQTKILDGVLIKIALERLRGEFPDKYVGIKSGKDGGKFIIINDFNRKNT